MTDDRDPTDGCTLHEALARFADSAKWQSYERARQAARGRRKRGYFRMLSGEPIVGRAAAEEMERSNALIEQRDRAWRDLCFDLISRLRSGELIATGLEEPLTLDRARRPIPPHLWQVLRPNFKHSVAVGGGLKISGIWSDARPWPILNRGSCRMLLKSSWTPTWIGFPRPDRPGDHR
jgi:hypothetical protein